MVGSGMVPMTRVIGTAALALVMGGCYTMQPVGRLGTDPGTSVALDVNDAGRVALGPSMGQGISRIEGRLLGAPDSTYVLAVSTVRFLRGGTEVWSGEQVRVSPDHVGSTYVRRFSRTRTVALGLAIAGGFAAVLLTRSLIGSGDDDPGDDPGGGELRTVSPRLPLWRLTPRGAFP